MALWHDPPPPHRRSGELQARAHSRPRKLVLLWRVEPLSQHGVRNGEAQAGCRCACRVWQAPESVHALQAPQDVRAGAPALLLQAPALGVHAVCAVTLPRLVFPGSRLSNPSALCERFFDCADALQFYETGCENCPRLEMASDRPRISLCTSANFNGCVSLPRAGPGWQ